VAVVPDQLHLAGPRVNSFPTNSPQTLIAMVENSFLGLPDQTVAFSAPVGAIQFTSGSVAGCGTSSSVVTDGNGAAPVSFIGTAPGPALIQASSGGVTAYSFVQVLNTGQVLAVTPAPSGDASPTLVLVGQANRTYDIQRSTDLLHWQAVATMTTPASGADAGVLQFTDSNGPSDHAFYRAVAH